MAKKTKSVTITKHRDGSFTLRSTGGVDLRKVVPSLFLEADKAAAPSDEAPAAKTGEVNWEVRQ